MSTQDVLLYVGIALIAIGVVLAAGAAYMFFSYNIPDIIADLSGKKRAQAIERMKEGGTGTLRRSTKRKASSLSEQPAAQRPGTEEIRAARQAAAQQVPEVSPAATHVKTDHSEGFSPLFEESATTVINEASGEELRVPMAEAAVEGDEAELPTKIISSDDELDAYVDEFDNDHEAVPAPRQEAVTQPEVVEATANGADASGWFQIVQKTVLTDSTSFVRVE